MNPKLLFAPLAALLLAACQSTVLESLPAGASASCPAEWHGAWIGLDEDSGEAADAGIHVARDCTTTLVERHAGKLVEVRLSPRFATVSGETLVFVDDKDAATQYRRDPPGREGWHPFAWRRDGKVLAVRPPDHRRIATLIVNGALDGATLWDGDEGENFVEGDPQEIEAALRNLVPFRDEAGFRLRSTGDDRKSLDRAIERAARDAEAESRRGSRGRNTDRP